jgi:hypothetical protein
MIDGGRRPWAQGDAGHGLGLDQGLFVVLDGVVGAHDRVHSPQSGGSTDTRPDKPPRARSAPGTHQGWAAPQHYAADGSCFTSRLRPSTLRGAFAWGTRRPLDVRQRQARHLSCAPASLRWPTFSAPRCHADAVPVRISCEEGQSEPQIMRLLKDRDALGLPLLEDRVELVGSTVDGQANLTGTRDIR